VKPSDRYLKIVEWSEEDQCYVGTCPGLMLGGVHGDDEGRVYKELCRVVEEWIRIYEEDGEPLPEATAGKDYSGKFVVRVGRRAPGSGISAVEVTNISRHGVWLLAGDKEFFMSCEDFPWFKDAPVGKILDVQEPSPGHFYWPALDVDLTTEIIEHPERFPLKAK
jgi:predicted RNase H-like HicB family nuclease